MGFLDKAKAAAEQAATRAKEGVEEVQTKRSLSKAYEDLGQTAFELIESGVDLRQAGHDTTGSPPHSPDGGHRQLFADAVVRELHGGHVPGTAGRPRVVRAGRPRVVQDHGGAGIAGLHRRALRPQ